MADPTPPPRPARSGSPTPCEVALTALAEGRSRSAAARMAGVSRMTVHRWIKSLIRATEAAA
jgi:transposase-like protein